MKKIYSIISDQCEDFYSSSKINITSTEFSSSKSILSIRFDTSIETPLLGNFSFSLNNKQVTSDDLKVTKMALGANASELQIFFEFAREIDKEIISIDTEWKWSIRSDFNDKQLFQDYPIKTEIFFYQSKAEKLIKSTEGGTVAVMTIFTTGMSLASIGAFLILVKLFQAFGYLQYLNLNIPKNVRTLLTIFSQNPLSLIPNPVHVPDIGLDCGLHQIIKDNGLECIVMNNVGGLIAQMIGFGLLKILTYYARKLTHMTFDEKAVAVVLRYKWLRVKYKLFKVARYFDKFLNVTFFCTLFYGIQTDYFLGLSTAPYAFRLNNGYSNMTMTPAYVMSLIYLILIFLNLKIYDVYYGKRQSGELSLEQRKAINRRWGSYMYQYKDFRKECDMGVLYYTLIMLKEFVLPLLIVYLIETPYIQTGFYIFFELLMAFFLWRNRPFKRTLIQVQVLWNSLLMAIVAILLLIVHIFEDKIGEKNAYYYIGFPIIGILLSVVAGNLGIGLWDSYQMVVEYFKTSRISKVKPVTEANNDLSQSTINQLVKSPNEEIQESIVLQSNNPAEPNKRQSDKVKIPKKNPFQGSHQARTRKTKKASKGMNFVWQEKGEL